MMSMPSRVIRLPASRTSRSRTSGGKDAWLTSNRNCTAVATLLTFWPPGPEARTKSSWISFASMTISDVIGIIPRSSPSKKKTWSPIQAVNSAGYQPPYISRILLTQSLLFDNNAADGPSSALLQKAAHWQIRILSDKSETFRVACPERILPAVFLPEALIFGFPGVLSPVWQSTFGIGKTDIGQVLFYMIWLTSPQTECTL